MATTDRKARIREYKENPPPSGIFQVRNTVTGRLLLGAAPDLPGMLNRQRFQLEMGSHPDRELQADWNELGPDAFELSVLDELASDDGTRPDAAELRVLHEMWLEKMAGRTLYKQSRRV